MTDVRTVSGKKNRERDPNWLQKTIRAASKEVHSWPCEKRGYHDRMKTVYRNKRHKVVTCKRCGKIEIQRVGETERAMDYRPSK